MGSVNEPLVHLVSLPGSLTRHGQSIPLLVVGNTVVTQIYVFAPDILPTHRT
mgnify:CR=1